jgi:hypothetical protein
MLSSFAVSWFVSSRRVPEGAFEIDDELARIRSGKEGQ